MQVDSEIVFTKMGQFIQSKSSAIAKKCEKVILSAIFFIF